MGVHIGSPEPSDDTTVAVHEPDDAQTLKGLAALEPGELGALFRSGDRTALAEVYRRFSPLVYTLSLRTLGQPSEAEGATQRVFIRAWRSRAGYDPDQRPLPAWLVGITRHVVADRMAERSRDSRLQQKVTLQDPTPGTTDDAIADRVADAVVVADGLAHLEQPRRRVLEMSFFDGLTHSQISERLGLPLGTVKNHIKRGLAQLKTHLEVSDEPS